jgi:ComF family protein
LKFGRALSLGAVFSKQMSTLFLETDWDVDLIMPVPLDPERKRERGYNQAGAIAAPLARTMKIPYQKKGLRRIRTTRPQVGLSREERERNMIGAFKAEQSNLNGNTVLVIDDVITTGATINACAKALIDAGAKCVFGLALARSVGQ